MNTILPIQKRLHWVEAGLTIVSCLGLGLLFSGFLNALCWFIFEQPLDSYMLTRLSFGSMWHWFLFLGVGTVGMAQLGPFPPLPLKKYGGALLLFEVGIMLTAGVGGTWLWILGQVIRPNFDLFSIYYSVVTDIVTSFHSSLTQFTVGLQAGGTAGLGLGVCGLWWYLWQLRQGQVRELGQFNWVKMGQVILFTFLMGLIIGVFDMFVGRPVAALLITHGQHSLATELIQPPQLFDQSPILNQLIWGILEYGSGALWVALAVVWATQTGREESPTYYMGLVLSFYCVIGLVSLLVAFPAPLLATFASPVFMLYRYQKEYWFPLGKFMVMVTGVTLLLGLINFHGSPYGFDFMGLFILFMANVLEEALGLGIYLGMVMVVLVLFVWLSGREKSEKINEQANF